MRRNRVILRKSKFVGSAVKRGESRRIIGWRLE
jgi:hypothetical protein